MEKMELIIKKNDAFFALRTIVRMNTDELEKEIIEGLINQQLIEKDFAACGMSFAQICADNGEDVDVVFGLIFPNASFDEFKRFSDALFVHGDGSENPCEDCGCEMDIEHDSFGNQEWTNFECPNPYCDNKISNEPDWDTLPGGHDNRFGYE